MDFAKEAQAAVEAHSARISLAIAKAHFGDHIKLEDITSAPIAHDPEGQAQALLFGPQEDVKEEPETVFGLFEEDIKLPLPQAPGPQVAAVDRNLKLKVEAQEEKPKRQPARRSSYPARLVGDGRRTDPDLPYGLPVNGPPKAPRPLRVSPSSIKDPPKKPFLRLTSPQRPLLRPPESLKRMSLYNGF